MNLCFDCAYPKKQRCVHGISSDCDKCKLHNLDNQIKSLQRSFNEKSEYFQQQINELSLQPTESLSAWNLLDDRIQKVEQLVYDEKEKFRHSEVKPHKCPICMGHGYFDIGTEGLRSNFKCRSCDGKGIVWNQN